LECKPPTSSSRDFAVRGLSILLPLVQFVLMVAIAASLTTVRVNLDRRNHRSWEQLVVRLDPGQGRRAAFRNACILLEMIDYACLAEKPIDGSLAEALRAEAMRVRLAAVLRPAPWA